MATEERTCERDGTLTRLTCVECNTPICPRCSVRTPVGLKCEEHGVGVVGPARRGVPKVAIGLGVVALVVAGLVVPTLLAGDDESTDTGNVVSGGIPANIARFALLGEEAFEGNLRFVANQMDCGAATVEGGSVTRVAQGRFCFVSITIRNLSQQPGTFSSSLQALTDNQNRRFGADDRATNAHPANEGRDLTSVLVNPGNELKGVLVFDVPQDAKPMYMNVHERSQGQGAYILLERPTR